MPAPLARMGLFFVAENRYFCVGTYANESLPSARPSWIAGKVGHTSFTPGAVPRNECWEEYRFL